MSTTLSAIGKWSLAKNPESDNPNNVSLILDVDVIEAFDQSKKFGFGVNRNLSERTTSCNRCASLLKAFAIFASARSRLLEGPQRM